MSWDPEKLRRKADQEDEMASLAFQDRDNKDGLRRHALARKYRERAAELMFS